MAIIQQHKEVKKVAVLIPAFCEEKTVGEVVFAARAYVDRVIVVDDASTDATAARAEAAGATVIRQPVNGGKGAALTEGFKTILEQGFDAVITMDADGFHDPDYIVRFLDTYYRTHIPVLIGSRMAEPHLVSPVRRWSIWAMSYWLYRLWGVYVPDPPSGFRFYRCDVLPFLLESASTLPAEFETLLHVASRRIQVGPVQIKKMAHRHKSIISPFRDIVRFLRVLYKFHKKGSRGETRIRIVEEER